MYVHEISIYFDSSGKPSTLALKDAFQVSFVSQPAAHFSQKGKKTLFNPQRNLHLHPLTLHKAASLYQAVSRFLQSECKAGLLPSP